MAATGNEALMLGLRSYIEGKATAARRLCAQLEAMASVGRSVGLRLASMQEGLEGLHSQLERKAPAARNIPSEEKDPQRELPHAHRDDKEEGVVPEDNDLQVEGLATVTLHAPSKQEAQQRKVEQPCAQLDELEDARSREWTQGKRPELESPVEQEEEVESEKMAALARLSRSENEQLQQLELGAPPVSYTPTKTDEPHLQMQGLRTQRRLMAARAQEQPQQPEEMVEKWQQAVAETARLQEMLEQLCSRLDYETKRADTAEREKEEMRVDLRVLDLKLEGKEKKLAEQEAQLVRMTDAAGKSTDDIHTLKLELKMLQLQDQIHARGKLPEEVQVCFEAPATTTGSTKATSAYAKPRTVTGIVKLEGTISVICQCVDCTASTGRYFAIAPTEWLNCHGHDGNDWSNNIKVHPDDAAEVQLGQGKRSLAIGKLLNLYGYDWNRASKAGCPTLFYAFRTS